MKTQGQDDVVRRLLRSEPDTTEAPTTTITRSISRVLYSLYPRGRTTGCISLPITPEVSAEDDRDPIDDRNHVEYLDHRSRIRQRRFRRNLCIIWSSVITSIVALAYALDVENSWRELEDRWAMSAATNGSRGPSWGTALPDQVTRIWGHSHNDEMHGGDAFTLALGLGFGSIEADVYLVTQDDGSKELMVGHLNRDLKSGRTLGSVYLDPILRILDKHNYGRARNMSWVGLLADDPHAEVQVVIDFKDDGMEMWPFVLDALAPLQDKGYLTSFSRKSGEFTRGPLTIIGTGNTPLSHVYYASERVIFYDAPLSKIHKPARIPFTPAGPAVEIQIDNTISPMASSKFPTLAHVGLLFYPAPNPVIGWMKRRTAEARRRGITSRWWGAANKPKWVRRRAWAMMKEAQTNWINGDDLHDLARWLRRLDNRS